MENQNPVEVDRNLLTCKKCKLFPAKPLQTACCDSVICSDCADKSSICPVCNDNDAIFNENSLLTSIIYSRKDECDICNLVLPFKHLASHQINEHQFDSFEKNKYEISNLKLREKSVFDIHRHFLVLATSSKDMICSSEKFTKSKNEFCIGKIKSELKFYACESCKICFCLNCVDLKQVKHYIQDHTCPLILTYKEHGWICNGKDLKDKCISEDSKFLLEDRKMRFRCSKCDYDLCGKCMEHYEI